MSDGGRGSRGRRRALAGLCALVLGALCMFGPPARADGGKVTKPPKSLTECQQACFDQYLANIAGCRRACCDTFLFFTIDCDEAELAFCTSAAKELLVNCLANCS